MGAGMVAAGGEVPELVRGFEVLAEAPDGPARMRELVRSLAVRGKLVQQDPREEPASELLDRLAKGRRLKARIREAPEPRVPSPFEIPGSWLWARFDLVAEIKSCLVSPADFQDLPHVAPDNIEKGTARLISYRSVREDGVRSSNHRFFRGQILYSKIRPNLSKLVEVDFEGLCSADMYPVSSHLNRRYLMAFMLSGPFLGQVTADDNRVAMPKVNQEQLNAVLVPVPPHDEQQRIVARVDELMALIDHFEAARTQREAERSAARDACLAKLCAAANPDEVATAWSTVASHFDTLFTSPDDIAPLRQSILQLAVRGKLVRQDSRDAPPCVPEVDGSVPFDRFEVSDGRLYALPKSWVWRRVHEVGVVQLGRQRSPEHHRGENMVPYLRVANVHEDRLDLTDVKQMNFTPEEQEVFRLMVDDVLLNEGQSYELVGRPAIYAGEIPGCCFQNSLLRWRSRGQVTPRFALLVFRTWMRECRFQRQSQQTTNIAHLSAGRLKQIEFPVPPLAEQHRIVARVDQLMTLCDQLESRLTAARQAALAFASASVVCVDTGSRIA